MKQIITIEIEEPKTFKPDYATIILLALYDRKEKLMSTFTEETEAQHTKVAIEIERLMDKVAKAKVRRV